MTDLLTDDEIADGLPAEWDREGDEIARVYEFDDYLDGVAYVTEVGELADEAYHHPTIEVRWREVEVRFTTHDAGGITQKDLDLAERCDERYAAAGG